MVSNTTLAGKVIDGAGAARASLTVELWEATEWESSTGSRTDYDTTDTDGLWNFDNVDSTKIYTVVVIDGGKKYLIDARNSIQLTELDLVTSLNVDTINEHTSENGVVIDNVTLKDGGVTFTDAIHLGDDDQLNLGASDDIVLMHRGSQLAADTTLTDLVEGSPKTLLTAADSAIITNITNDGDIHLIASKAGNSFTGLHIDGSTGETSINATTGAVVRIRVDTASEVTFSATAVDLNSNHLDNSGYLILDAVTAPASSEVYLVHDNTGDLTLNALSGKTVNIAVAGTDEVTISATTVDLKGNALTTTGLITGGSLDIDDVLINGTTIGHTDDTDLMTVADGLLTVAGEISVTTLDIGGTNVTTTAAEINLIDGGTARGTTAIADGDGVLINDAGTMRMTTVQTLATYMESEIDTFANLEVTTELQTALIAYTDGDAAITIADGGGITAAAGITSTAGANTFGASSFSGAVDIQGGYANAGGAPYDGVVDVGGGGNWDVLQDGDDALDDSDYTMLVKSGAYGAGLIVATNDVYIYVEPGTAITGDIALSGNSVKIEFGPGCNLIGTLTLSGSNCSAIFGNGCDTDGIIVSGNYGFVDGGGWDTITNGADARTAIAVSGTDAIIQNIAVQTTPGGGNAYDGVNITSGGERFSLRNVLVIDCDNQGFSVDGPDGSIIGCTILGTDDQGILVIGDGHTCRIIGNRITATGAQGILFSDGANCTAVGNDIQATTGVSVELNAAGDYNVIVGNRLDGAVTDGSSNSEVSGNVVTAY